MKNISQCLKSDASGVAPADDRQGSFLILALLCLVGCLAAASLSADVGYLTVQKNRMQNAVDSAALAAAQEITNAVRNAPQGTSDPTAYAIQQARTTAAYVAGLNGVYVDATQDVTFGQRQYNTSSKTWTTTWGATPANVVKVTARRTGSDPSAPDGKMKTFFGGVGGNAYATVTTQAVAFIQARDIAIVHDFSRSMNFDTYFNEEATVKLTTTQTLSNLSQMWQDLQPLNVGSLPYTPTWWTYSQTSSGVTAKVTFQLTSCTVTTSTSLSSVTVYYGSSSSKTYSASGQSATYTVSSNITSVSVSSAKTSGNGTVSMTFADNNTNIMSTYGLDKISFPFPAGSWNEFLNHCRNYSQYPSLGYQEQYSGQQMMDYMLRNYPSFAEFPQLCLARHYPFSLIKNGHTLLCSFLKTLSFDDHIGMISYDTNHRTETQTSSGGLTIAGITIPVVNISSNPVSGDYDAVNNLMLYKQAAYYSDSTNMGGGMSDATAMLTKYARAGSQPTILLMTDGVTNAIDSGVSTSLPSGWNWDTLLDYDGDGVRDYYTTSSQKTYCLSQAYAAVQKGYTIHAISVGAMADTALMQAIAFLGNGVYVNVPGGTGVDQMQAQLNVAFQKIASMVPPATLLNPDAP